MAKHSPTGLTSEIEAFLQKILNGVERVDNVRVCKYCRLTQYVRDEHKDFCPVPQAESLLGKLREAK